jgi:hypothetical protein
MLQWRLLAQPLTSVSFESMVFLCNSCRPMHLFWYASTIGWLADPVVTLLMSAIADTILLFCPTSTAHSRCIGDAHTILRFSILDVFHIGYDRSILSFPILIHTLPSADLSTERSAIRLSVTYPKPHSNRLYVTQLLSWRNFEPTQPHLVT